MGFARIIQRLIPRLHKSTLLHLDTVARCGLTLSRGDAIITSTLAHFHCPICCSRRGFILHNRWILLKPAPKFLLVGPWTAYLVHGYRRAHVRKIFCLVCADAQKFANFVVALQNLLLRIHIRTRPFRLFTPPARCPARQHIPIYTLYTLAFAPCRRRKCST